MASDDGHDPGPSRPSGLASVLKNLTGSRPRLQSTSVSVEGQNHPDITYGSLPRTLSRTGLADLLGRSPTPETAISSIDASADIQAFIGDVGPDQPLASRIATVEAATRVCQQFSADEAMEFWQGARGLLHTRDSLEAQMAGVRTLESICGRPDLTDAAKRTLLNDIRAHCFPDAVPHLLRALVKLTNHAKDISFTETAFVPVVQMWLDSLYNVVAATKQNLRKEKASQRSNKVLAEQQADLTIALQFIAAVITAGHERRLPSYEVHSLVRQVASICKKTTAEVDIRFSLGLYDAVLRNLNVGTTELLVILELVCGTYASVTSLLMVVSETTSALLESKKADETMQLLVRFMTEPPHEYSRNLNVVRGAILVLREIIIQYPAKCFEQLGFDAVLDAVAAARFNDNARLDADVLNLCCSLLGSGVREQSLRCDWTKFLDIISQCSERALQALEPTLSSGQSIRSQAKGHGESIEGIAQHTTSILERFAALRDALSRDQLRLVVAYFVKMNSCLQSEQQQIVIDFYRQGRYCNHSSEEWLANTQLILNSFFKDHNLLSTTRLRALSTLEQAVLEDDKSLPSYVEAGIVKELVDCMVCENDYVVMKATVLVMASLASRGSDELGQMIAEALRSFILKPSQARGSSPPAGSPSGDAFPILPPTKTLAGLASNCLVRILVRGVNTSAQKAIAAFNALLLVTKSATVCQDARLIALKALFSIRCDTSGAIYILHAPEIESIESALLRMSDGILMPTPAEQGRAALTRVTARISSAPGAPKRLPSWTLMKEVLSETPSNVGSPYVAAFITPVEPEKKTDDRILLKINIWLEQIIFILQRELDWEIYSYAIVHLGSQITNNDLFRNARAQIKLLRSVLCDQIKNRTFHTPPNSTGMKKAEVAACIFEILAKLLAFREDFAQSEEDELVRTFLLGIGSWDGTTRYCIHALSICNLEIPLSVTKSLNAILAKMAQIITLPHIAVHVLEFLASMSRLPDVFANLRDEEIRTVFGICVRYLQTAREHRYQANSPPATRSSNTTSWPPAGVRDLSSPISFESGDSVDGMSQYVYILTYQVMISWFLALKLRDRANHVNWITRRLVFTDENGKEVVEEQSQVLIDMMQRTAYSDLGETVSHSDFAKPEDGHVISKSWIVGMSVVTIETAAATGLTQITKRMASGTTHATYQQHTAPLPPHHVHLRTGENVSISDTLSITNSIYPSHVMLQLAASAMPMTPSSQPLPLPEDEATKRSLRVFDRFDTVDGHKAGIVYISEGQTHEKDILANSHGSPFYEQFLAGLGTKVPLKDAGFNLQGLIPDVDGEATYAWRDRVSEIVYHVTTMMPTDLERDPQCINKKRHIGNDFVNVIYNDSIAAFKFDTIPSQFNAINIVVEPTCRSAAHPSPHRTDTVPFEKSWFKLTVLSKPEYPSVSPSAEPKVVSGANLAACIRLFIINASVFTLVWSARESGDHMSSWRHRLREIKKLRDKCTSVPGEATKKSGADLVEGEYMGYRSSRTKSTYPEEAAAATKNARTNLVKRDNASDISGKEREESIVESLDFTAWAS